MWSWPANSILRRRQFTLKRPPPVRRGSRNHPARLPRIASFLLPTQPDTRLVSAHYWRAELLHPPPSLSKSINFLTAISFPFFAAALSKIRACAQFFGTLSPCTYISARTTSAEILPLATSAQSDRTVSAPLSRSL